MMADSFKEQWTQLYYKLALAFDNITDIAAEIQAMPVEANVETESVRAMLAQVLSLDASYEGEDTVVYNALLENMIARDAAIQENTIRQAIELVATKTILFPIVVKKSLAFRRLLSLMPADQLQRQDFSFNGHNYQFSPLEFAILYAGSEDLKLYPLCRLMVITLIDMSPDVIPVFSQEFESIIGNFDTERISGLMDIRAVQQNHALYAVIDRVYNTSFPTSLRRRIDDNDGDGFAKILTAGYARRTDEKISDIIQMLQRAGQFLGDPVVLPAELQTNPLPENRKDVLLVLIAYGREVLGRRVDALNDPQHLRADLLERALIEVSYENNHYAISVVRAMLRNITAEDAQSFRFVDDGEIAGCSPQDLEAILESECFNEQGEEHAEDVLPTARTIIRQRIEALHTLAQLREEETLALVETQDNPPWYTGVFDALAQVWHAVVDAAVSAWQWVIGERVAEDAPLIDEEEQHSNDGFTDTRLGGSEESAAPSHAHRSVTAERFSSQQLQATQHQVDEVIAIMRGNMERELERDAQDSGLIDRTHPLRVQTSRFESTVARLRPRNSLWQRFLSLFRSNDAPAMPSNRRYEGGHPDAHAEMGAVDSRRQPNASTLPDERAVMAADDPVVRRARGASLGALRSE